MTDQEIVDKMIADAATAPTAPEAPKAPTIADRYVSMATLVKEVRTMTHLNEGTLTKLMELALNYHVWSTQREDANPDQPWITPTEAGPIEPHEVITEATDNTEEETTPDA
jgi:hypothetical protein